MHLFVDAATGYFLASFLALVRELSTSAGRGGASGQLATMLTGPSEAQKLQLVVRNCVQKSLELILLDRVVPLTTSMRRGAPNHWVREVPEDDDGSIGFSWDAGHASLSTGAGIHLQLARRRSAAARNAATYASGHCQPPPQARGPTSPPPSSPNPTQFNLESDEIGVVRDQLDGWRQQISQPITLDIFISSSESHLIREAVGVQVRPAGTPTRDPRGQRCHTLMPCME